MSKSVDLRNPDARTGRLRRVRLALLPAVAGLALAACQTVPAPAPKTSATASAGGKVTLYRDNWGMPHLYAAREEDGYYGLGYAVAEDRLEQLLVNYLMVEGRLAETFGPGPKPLPGVAISAEVASALGDTVASDKLMRRNRYPESVRANLPHLPPQLVANAKSFVAGIERYMRDHPEKVPAWAPKIDYTMPLAVYSAGTHFDQDNVCTDKLGKDAHAAREGVQNPAMASNAWAVDASKTAAGKVIFSSDSHGALANGGPLFYTYRIKAGELDLLGNDYVGSIAMVLSHSATFGWGWAEGPRFTADCYAVKVNADDANAYRYDGETRRIEQVPYSIAVKGGAPVTGTFEYTNHNGVRSAVVKRVGDTAYVSSSAYNERAGLAEAQYRAMAVAKTYDEFYAALESRSIYPANLIIGGADGTILYIRPGRIPARKAGVDVTKILDGNTSATAWSGITALKDLLQLKNPAEGYLVNANVSPEMMLPGNPVLDPKRYPDYFAMGPKRMHQRQQRLAELAANANNLTIEQAVDIVLDDKIIGTEVWGPTIRAAMAQTPAFAKQSPQAAAFVDALIGFDGHFTTKSRGALYHLWLRETMVRTTPADADAIIMAVEAGKPLSKTQQKLLADNIAATFASLQKQFGTTELSYGDVFRIRRGSVDLPSDGGNIVVGIDLPEHNHVPIGGKVLSVRAAPHANTHVPDADGKRKLIAGTRVPFVVSYTSPVKSYGATAFGTSNDPQSPWYGNQMKLVGEDRLKSNYFDLSELKANVASETVLDTGPAR